MSRLDIKKIWQFIRRLSGDDAYERYLIHCSLHHPHATELPLSKAEFFKYCQDKKWQGINRCC